MSENEIDGCILCVECGDIITAHNRWFHNGIGPLCDMCHDEITEWENNFGGKK